MLERLRSDVIDAVRSLLATTVTTFATVLLLAVATGANLAVFGLIDRAILTPARHVVRPDRLFTLGFGVPGDAARGAGMTSTSYVAFDTIREHAPAHGAGSGLAEDVHDGRGSGGADARRRDAGVGLVTSPSSAPCRGSVA